MSPAPIVMTISSFFTFALMYSAIFSKSDICKQSTPFLVRASAKSLEWISPGSFSLAAYISAIISLSTPERASTKSSNRIFVLV